MSGKAGAAGKAGSSTTAGSGGAGSSGAAGGNAGGASGQGGAAGEGSSGQAGSGGKAGSGNGGVGGEPGEGGAAGDAGTAGAGGESGASGHTGAGAAGESGASGQAGAGGDAGTSGLAGAGAGGGSGTSGQSGTAGSAGTAGAGGDSAAAGESGAAGAAGDSAVAGAAGTAGAGGDTGTAGNAGAGAGGADAGTAGAAGDTGTAGAAGADGGESGTSGQGGAGAGGSDGGAAGDTGSAGTDSVGGTSSGAAGDAGAGGDTGTAGTAGAGGEAGTAGAAGDTSTAGAGPGGSDTGTSGAAGESAGTAGVGGSPEGAGGTSAAGAAGDAGTAGAAGAAGSGTTSVCGDGVIAAAEECDDGDVAAGDGCSDTCTIEVGYVCSGSPSVCVGIEEEPNNVCAVANGPYTIPFLATGSLSPKNDVDVFSFTVPAYADVRIETFGPKVGECPSPLDTIISLFGDKCGTKELAYADLGGIGECSLIDPATKAGARRLAPGVYTVEVESFQGKEAPAYSVQVTFAALCGNGIKEGSEQCDGGDDCGADCVIKPGCGDGKVDAGEACDDGGKVAGDGCSATCAIEPGYVCNGVPSACYPGNGETEDNGTCAAADGPYTVPFVFAGSMTKSDTDYVSFVVPTYSDVRIETFGPKLNDCPASGADSKIRLFNATCSTELAVDDDGGIANCALIDTVGNPGARRLAPGTYVVQLTNAVSTPIPAYNVQVSFTAVCGNGVKEGSEQCDGAVNCTTDCLFKPGCGDGKLDAGEQCDDTNVQGGDGCSATCQLEAGYSCTGAPSVCAKPCADGETLVSLVATGLPKGTPSSVAPVVANPMITTVTSTTAGTVKRAVARLSITHTWDGDLTLTLVSPGGTSVALSTKNGGSGDNYTSTVFDQKCTTSIASGKPPYTGCFKPEGSLAAVEGLEASGDWKLQIADSSLSSDSGTLTAWTLDLCVAP